MAGVAGGGDFPPPTVCIMAISPHSDARRSMRQVLRHRDSPHRCLGVDAYASKEVVRKRFLALALRIHPDKIEHAHASEAFAAVEAAFRVLSEQ